MKLLLSLALAFLLSLLTSKVLIALTPRFPWLSRSPSQGRWHKKATTSMGGIAMFLSFVLIVFSLGSVSWLHVKLLLGGSLIFGLGLWDDVRSLRPYEKLAGQIAIASLVCLTSLPTQAAIHPILYVCLALVWIVGITNAFNLLDNMDGLAAGIALIGACFLALLSQISEGPSFLGMLLPFMGVIAGFLIFNRYPARLFMGDCGSQWLGFMLATLTIFHRWQSASSVFLMMVTPLFLLAIPIFDTTLVALHRKIQGRPISQGGKDHSSHRLVAFGLSEGEAVWVFWGLSFFFGLVAFLAHLYKGETWGLLAGGAIVVMLLLGIFLSDVKVYEPVDKVSGPVRFRPFHELLFKRRIVEVLIDTMLMGGAYVLAYLLRYDWSLDGYLLNQIQNTLPIVIAGKLVTMLFLGLYQGLWTYIDFHGVLRLLRVSVVASMVTILSILALYRFEGFSRTLFFIDFSLLLLLMAGSRALLRALRESVFAFPESGRRLLIVGAGDTCRFLLNEIRRNRQWNLRPVAIVDESRRLSGRVIQDVPIVGSYADICKVVSDLHIEHIVVSTCAQKSYNESFVTEQCKTSGIPFVCIQPLEETVFQKIAQ